jgi:hypothetical protein
MTRIWKICVVVLATAYFVVDGLFSYVTRPITVWIGKMRAFERARRWIVSLRPYPWQEWWCATRKRGHLSPGHHVEGGSLAEIFVGRGATRWLRL